MIGTGWNQLERKTQDAPRGAALRFLVVGTLIVLSSTGFASVVPAQDPRGSATGPATAKGYDHPGQYLHMQDVKPADNMYPVVQHPEQDAEARRELAARLRKA
jgi:arylsulfatase